MKVKLRVINGQLELRIRDNGIGITREQLTNNRSLGILGMRERAQVWGGDVNIDGTENEGTVVTINIRSF